MTLIVNDFDQKLINFNVYKTAILELSADPFKNTASVKLAPANRDREILLSCNNQRITGDQSVNCPVSSSSVTQVELTDVTPVIKEEKSKFPSISFGGLVGATINQCILGVATAIFVPEVGVTGAINSFRATATTT